jgi:hypothetical protein
VDNAEGVPDAGGTFRRERGGISRARRARNGPLSGHRKNLQVL